MKIVGLCASPRANGNTQRLLKHFLKSCEQQGAETEFYSTNAYRVDYCTACEQCMRDGSCPIKDDFMPLLPRITDADALVIASPNYAFDISAQLKAVFDRSHAFVYYSQALHNVYGVGICVAGHPALSKSIAKRCAQVVWLCGGNMVGHLLGISKHRDKKGFVHESRLYAKADRLALKLVKAIKKRKTYPLQTWFRETFIVPKLKQIFSRRREEYPFVAETLLDNKSNN